MGFGVLEKGPRNFWEQDKTPPRLSSGGSRGASWLGFCLFLLLLVRLCFFLALLALLFDLAFAALHLLRRRLDRFEKPLEAGLLGRFEILAEAGGRAAHAVFAEALFRHEEGDEAVDVGRGPFEVAVRVVRRAHVRVEEELSRVAVGPVGGDGVALFRVGGDVRDDVFERAVVADQFESRLGADFGDRVDVVAAEKDAEVDELVEGGVSSLFLLSFFSSLQ